MNRLMTIKKLALLTLPFCAFAEKGFSFLPVEELDRDSFEMDVFLEGLKLQRIGQVPVVVSPAGETLWLSREGLLKLVEGRLSPEGFSRFQKALEGDLFLEDGKKIYIGNSYLSFSLSSQKLNLFLDPKEVKHSFLRLSASSTEELMGRNFSETPGVPVYPSKVSGYLNVSAGARLHHSYRPIETGFSGTRQSYAANFELNANVQDWVLHAFAYATEGVSQGINRGSISVSRDFPDLSMRMHLGDISTTTSGFQNSIPLFGVNFSKSHTFFNNTLIGPASQHEIFLQTPSTIDIYISDVLIRTLELPAGSYTLGNFPLLQGTNNVELHIRGITGEEEKINLGFFYSSNLLTPGQNEWFFSCGVPSYQFSGTTNAGRYRYQFNSPTLSALYRIGYSDHQTLSVYLQGDKNSAFFGGQSNFSLDGLMGTLDAGLSYLSNYSTPDGRLRLTLNNTATPSGSPFLLWRGSIDLQGMHFAYLGDKSSMRNPMVALTGSVSKNLFEKVATSFGVGYEFNRFNRDTYNMQLSMGTRLLSTLSLRSFLSYRHGYTTDTYQAVLGCDWSPSGSNMHLSSNYNAIEETLNANASYFKNLGPNQTLSTRVGVSKAPGRVSPTFDISYSGEKFSLGAYHHLARNSARRVRSTVGTTGFNFSTALVYAGGHVGITHRVRDSFVIVAQPSKSDFAVFVNPSVSGDYLSRTVGLLPAVAKDVTSYRPYPLRISAPTAPYGYSFKDTNFVVHPTYKSGSVIELDPRQFVVFEGVMKWDDGQVMKNVSGFFVSTDRQKEYLPFFTNHEGEFQVASIEPGRYQVLVAQESHLIHYVDIPKAEDGDFLILGDVSFNSEERYK